MGTLKTYSSFAISSALLLIGLLLVFPYYQYYIDPDATAYLSIAQRYDAGDFMTAVNGYWSPWSCWLTAFFIKLHFAPFIAAVIVNALAAVCLLFISHSFFLRFIEDRKLIYFPTITLSIFLVYAVFKQSFDDLWECFFLLLILRIFISQEFLLKPYLLFCVGVLGALAYFAKAYSFPFFILEIISCGFLITNARVKTNRKIWIKIVVVSVGVMILCSMPWVYLLHKKYGEWMTSSAGSLNLSWYLVGHPYYKEGIDILVPPVHPSSISFWEDPYLVMGKTPHFWDSLSLLGLQFVRFCYTLLKLFLSMNEISAFFLPVTLFSFLAIFSKRIGSFFDQKIKIVCTSFLLFPLGYLLINFEARYIWYMLPISLMMGIIVLQRLRFLIERKSLFYTVIFIFCFSYLVFPIWDMKAMYREGEKEYNIAQTLKQHNVEGTFAANKAYGRDYPRIMRLAYFSGNQYYNTPLNNFSSQEFLHELQRYKINYYFSFQNDNEVSYPLNGTGVYFEEMKELKIDGLNIYKINYIEHLQE